MYMYMYVWIFICVLGKEPTDPFFDGYCSTVQGLLDWFEVDLGFTRAFIYSNRFVCSVCLRSPLVLFWTFCTASPARWECL